jgi:septal ring factor EnvC (AmiA/AmiB activator)
MPLVKVTNSSFVRDTQSMAIINVDNQAKQEYYEKVRLLSKQKEQINKINDEIKELRDDVGEIKNLLKQLVSKE